MSHSSIQASASNGLAAVVPFQRRTDRDRKSSDRPQKLVARVCQALDEERVEMRYQPQYCLASGALVGVEALLRLDRSDGGYWDTLDIVGAAEGSELIGALGRLVRSTACREYAELRARGIQVGRLAINISPLELNDPEFPESVVDAVFHSGLEFSDVELEVTEGYALCRPSIDLDPLHQLAELGMGVAVDDFGAGYACWQSVLEFPFTTVKVDKALVRGIGHDARARTIFGHIVQTSHELGCKVVAEGLNTPQQLSAVTAHRCNIGQGFGLGVPVTAPLFSTLCQSRLKLRSQARR